MQVLNDVMSARKVLYEVLEEAKVSTPFGYHRYALYVVLLFVLKQLYEAVPRVNKVGAP